MLKLYGMSTSGNCYKLKLLLEQLGKPYQWQEVDILQGESQTDDFLAMNPMGQVPTLEVKHGKYLTESNAILCYLADETSFWPDEPYAKAQTLSWMFFEQYSHEPYIAVARFICKFLPTDTPRRAELPHLHERGTKALQIMEQHLASNDYFAADHYSIADIALYAYTHCAEEGGFNLQEYPSIKVWLCRVEQERGFIPMEV